VRIFEIYYAEAKYSIVKKDDAAAWAQAAKVLEGLRIDFHSTTRALADSAADFKARFKLSLADAFAAALAREKKAGGQSGCYRFSVTGFVKPTPRFEWATGQTILTVSFRDSSL
jgi:predicted nucleic acid-binding protein